MRIQIQQQYEVFNGLENVASRISLQPCHIAVFELLHHYSTAVYSTLSTIPLQQEVWRASIVQIAFKHGFLLQGILAMSALHLAHTKCEKSQAYMLEATHHQSMALTEFRDLLSGTISFDDAKPLFLYSGFLTIYAFGLPGVEGRSNPNYALKDVIDEFLTCANLARGMATLLSPQENILWTIGHGGLVQRGQQSNGIPLLHGQSVAELRPLSKLYTICNAEPCLDTCCIYLQATQQLHAAFVAFRDSSRLEDAQSPIFTALSWCFRGWEKILMEVTASALGETYEELLSWPKEMVGLV